MEKPLLEFAKTLEFLREHHFEVFRHPLELFFKNFQRETEERFCQKINETTKGEIRWMIFDYLGFTTSYQRINKEEDVYLCPQIWTFQPFIDDFFDIPPFEYILERIERMTKKKIPIEELLYHRKPDTHIVEFKFRNDRYELRSYDLVILGNEFIFKISELVKGQEGLPNIWIINLDPGVLMTCQIEDFDKITRYFGIEERHIL